MSARLRILKALVESNGWLFGPDVAILSDTFRPFVYARLGALIEAGFVEMRDDPRPPRVPGAPRRQQYRAMVTWRTWNDLSKL